MKFDFANRELIQVKEDSPSYPGVRTVYRKRIPFLSIQEAPTFPIRRAFARQVILTAASAPDIRPANNPAKVSSLPS